MSTLMFVYAYLYNTRTIKNISNKNERRCRDVKTQKACEQGYIGGTQN